MAQNDLRLTDPTVLQPAGGILVGAQGVQGTWGVGSRSRAWRAALLATALLFGQPAGDVPGGAQPDTYTQSVAGTSALALTQQQFRSRALLATTLVAQDVDQPTGPVPLQPDTWTQSVSGTGAGALAQRQFTARSVAASTLLWTNAVDETGVTTWPDTWPQPVQGTRSIGQAARLFATRAGQFALNDLQPPPEDQSGPLPLQPDTWPQPIPGTAAFGQAARQFAARSSTASALLWTNNPDDTGISTAPDLYTQPVVGSTALRLTSAQFTARAVQATGSYLTAPALDPSTIPQPDTWTPPTPGTPAIGQAARAFAARAIQQFSQNGPPDDLSGALAVQPDTWTSPTPAAASIARGQRAFTQRSAQAGALLWTTPEDPPQGAAVPDTWTSPTAGTAALLISQRSFAQRAVVASALAGTNVDETGVTIQPENWTPQAVGTAALRQTQRAFTQRSVQALALLSGADTTGISTQPDTYQAPVAGLASLGQRGRQFSARAATQSALLWTENVDTTGVTTQNDQWTPPIVGSGALRLTGHAFTARATHASALLWITPEDGSAPLPLQPDTWLSPIAGISALRHAHRAFTRQSVHALARLSGADTTGISTQLVPGGGSATPDAYFVVAAQGRWFAVPREQPGRPLPIGPSYVDQVLTLTPIAYWRLGDATGPAAVDRAGHGHDATYLSGVTLGQIGALGDGNGAIDVDGTLNGRATIPASALTTTGAFSVELWLNADTLVMPLGGRMVWSGGDATGNNSLTVIADGSIDVTLRINGQQVGAAANPPIVVGQWFHVVGTWDGTYVRLYVNGALAGTSVPASGPLDLGSGVGAIGGYLTTQPANFSWDGQIDEVALYAQALTPDQIAAHYAARLQSLTDGRAFTVDAQGRIFDGDA
jgi:phage-related protein